ncbi:MAG TPA: lysophospholipid acyltransferase family protein [Pseudonocardiaceae bacterium]|jgi:1-acyl-sn-glycerol-3-phosphate acyltransferase|nr:lysophospholipid acyltransferase family protein [Pseudonocardiaceae bacterium]
MSGDLPPGSWPWLNDLAQPVCRWVLAVLLRRRVFGRDRVPASGPVVLVANHSSLLDGPVIGSIIRRRPVFLIKREIFRGPLGVVLRRVGQLSVRRGEPDREPLLAAVAVLRAGGLVGIFPEGTRGSGEVAAAHNGAAWLARSGGAVLLPVACRGTLRPAGARRRWRPRVDVLVGQPLPAPTQRGRAGLAEATEKVRVALAELVTELDRLRDGGKPDLNERKVERK